MTTVITITGSPSVPSRSAALALHVEGGLRARGFACSTINVRDLPPGGLIAGRADEPAIAAAIRQIEAADAAVIVTPIYKAAYSGILKTFLDVLPQFALAGKVVLPLATGGTLAHVLALDYALRPVLVALGAQHIVNGLFVLDKTITLSERGLVLEGDVEPRLAAIVEDFVASVQRRAIPASA